MQIGYAQRDITPPPGEEMCGYGFHINRRAEGTLDPLYARACAFRDGRRTAVLVQLDLIGLGQDYVDQLRAMLHRAHGLAPDAVLFHAIHTHTGPASMTFFGLGELTQTLRGILAKGILETVGRALATWRPLDRARWFQHACPGIAHNRDDADGPVDHLVRGLLLELDGAPPVALASFGCHPVAFGLKRVYSADYPGALAECLAARGVRSVFLTGPCGDINPLVNTAEWGTGTRETLRIYGRRLAAAVEAGLADATEVSLDSVRWVSRDVPLGVVPPDRASCQADLAKAEAALDGDPADGPARSTLNGTRHWLATLDRGGALDRQPVEAQAIDLGGVTIAGVGAELFSELGEVVRQRSGRPRLLLAGTCNAVRCYISTRRSVERASYSAQSARFYGVFPQRPGAGEQFAEDVAALLRDPAWRDGP